MVLLQNEVSETAKMIETNLNFLDNSTVEQRIILLLDQFHSFHRYVKIGFVMKKGQNFLLKIIARHCTFR